MNEFGRMNEMASIGRVCFGENTAKASGTRNLFLNSGRFHVVATSRKLMSMGVAEHSTEAV
jgi:hypothetical protein